MTHSLGQQLKEERESQRLSLEKVFEATRIRIQYLQALEADDLSVMPSPVQARGYLRNYAEYLGLDVEQMLTEMRASGRPEIPGEVIGPADEFAAIPQQEPEPVETQAASPAAAVSELIEESASVEEPVSAPSLTVPVKAKPARRKKADGPTTKTRAAAAEPTTTRRGRKKMEPEPAPVIEPEPEIIQELAAPVEAVVEPVNVEEAVAQVEPAPEPVLEENLQSDVPQPVDVSDSLWQSWLNRLGSTLSARMKRRTLVPKEEPLSESNPVLPEPEIVSEAVPPLENPTEILKEIGDELRERRELLSLHLEEVERNTHVKAHYLDALERGALDDLPSTVQTRGMLSNYATFLDLDVDTLLLRFADALQARHRERNPQKSGRKPGEPIVPVMPPVRSFVAGDMIFGVGMVVLLVGFAIWGVSRVMTLQSQREVKPTAPSISDVLLAPPDPASFTATPTFLPVESFPGEATVTVEIPTLSANADVQLNLVAVERTYMRVLVDGEVAFEGRVVRGNAYPFEAESQIEDLVGSGAAIRIVYNGRDMGLMGTFGQVVNNIYLASEVITPTALPTDTPTITPTPTRTAVPTATLRPSSTPRPSATPAP